MQPTSGMQMKFSLEQLHFRNALLNQTIHLEIWMSLQPHSIYISTAKMEVQSISGKWLALLFLKWAETQQLRSEIDSQKEVIDRRLAKLIV